MDRNGSENGGCLIVVVALGALLLFLDYGLMRAHSVPPFCNRPACVTMRELLDISGISSLVALGCAALAAIIWPRVLLIATVGALIVSVVAGFRTGIALWSVPNAIVTFVLTWLLLIRWLDQ